MLPDGDGASRAGPGRRTSRARSGRGSARRESTGAAESLTGQEPSGVHRSHQLASCAGGDEG